MYGYDLEEDVYTFYFNFIFNGYDLEEDVYTFYFNFIFMAMIWRRTCVRFVLILCLWL